MKGVLRTFALSIFAAFGMSAAHAADLEIEVKTLPPVAAFDANPKFLDEALARHLFPVLNRAPDFTGAQSPARPTVVAALAKYAPVEPPTSAQPRKGAVADGVSALLLRALVPGPGEVGCRVTSLAGARNDEKEGRCRLVFPGDPVLQLGAADGPRHVFAVYTPPKAFGAANFLDQALFKHPGRRAVNVTISWRPKDSAAPFNYKTRRTLILERPPVVLVHGTYDNPTECWAWGKSDESWTKAPPDYRRYPDNFATRLRNEGFRVFLVNFRRSNGMDQYVTSQETTWTPAGPTTVSRRHRISSHFRSNQMAAWNGGSKPFIGPEGKGIEQALEELRGEEIAATQADVVGHSMGGVLIRVYARGVSLPRLKGEQCLPRATSIADKNWYYRTDNFGAGDINRIITIGSTHMGSHISGFLDEHRSYLDTVGSFAEQERARTIGAAAAAPRQSGFGERLLGDIFVLGATYQTGKLSPGAFTDQIPMSPALSCLGPTPVPAHAIGAVATVPDLDYFAGTAEGPKGIYRERMEKIWNSTTGWLFDLPNTGVLDDIFLRKFNKPETYRAVHDAIEALRRDLRAKSEAIYNKRQLESQKIQAARARQTFQIPRIEQAIAHLERQIPILTERAERTREKAMTIFMYAVFGNDYTDFVVSLDSQLGGLGRSSRATTIIPKRFDGPGQTVLSGHGVLHGYEPRHWRIQDRTIALLKGGMENFDENGFPASRLPRFYSPQNSPVGLYER